MKTYFLNTNITILLKLELKLLGTIDRFWLTISAILDSEKATLVASGHPG